MLKIKCVQTVSRMQWGTMCRMRKDEEKWEKMPHHRSSISGIEYVAIIKETNNLSNKGGRP